MHADGGDEQDQHARVGERLEGEPVDERPHRHDQRQGDERVDRHAGLHRRERGGEREQGDGRDDVAGGDQGEPARLEAAAGAQDLDHRRGDAEADKQLRRAGERAVLQRRHGQGAPGDELALGDENHPRDREHQHQRHAEQRIDRAVHHAVLGEEEENHRAHGRPSSSPSGHLPPEGEGARPLSPGRGTRPKAAG